MSALRALRSDAVRNRERVMQAAREVFAERGLEAGIPDIAARAGVGKATVYRSFPTKEHLIAAIAAERLESFAEAAEAAELEPDAWRAFTGLLAASALRQVSDRAVIAGLAHVSLRPELVETQQRTFAALSRLMRRAKREGRMRRDAKPSDVRLLMGGVSRMLAADGEADPAVWRHAARLVADAFRA